MTYWKDQERRVKKVLEDRGWTSRRNPGSGNLPFREFKNDVHGTFPSGISVSIDHKSTHGQKSISIKREDLMKAFKDAEANNDFGIVTWNYYGKHQLYAAIEFDTLLDILEGRYGVHRGTDEPGNRELDGGDRIGGNPDEGPGDSHE